MNELNGYDIEDLQPGMQATYSKTLTEADIVLFAAVSGDNNAVHTNEEFAASTRFGGRIAHGFLTASVISAAVANRLPGPGAVYLAQQMRFKAPVRPGDTLATRWLVVKKLDKPKHAGGIVVMKCEAKNQHGDVVVEADGKILVAARAG